MRMKGIKKKLYLFTCDKPEFHKKALQMKRSMDEVKRLLCVSSKKD